MIDSGWSTGANGADSLESGDLSSPRRALIAGDWARQVPRGAETRLMFQRMLASWASDVLSLRQRGLDRPRHHGRWSPALKSAA